jgi:hypothetical protein
MEMDGFLVAESTAKEEPEFAIIPTITPQGKMNAVCFLFINDLNY